MTPKCRDTVMERDDVIWEKVEDDLEKWELSVNRAVIYRGVAALILKYRPGDAVELHMPIKGGYNAFYRLKYKDGSSVGMRIPCQGIVKFPEEKIRYDAIYGWGTAEENPTGLGPFMILEYIEHSRTLSEAMNDPNLELKDRHVLDPNIDEHKLSFLYSQMANIPLQLSVLTFPRIGPLDRDASGHISVSGRPITMNMNNLVEHTAIPSSILPTAPHSYASTTAWYSALADMHLTQLTFQHNDAIDSASDARDKYVARQLFRRLARQGRLNTPSPSGAEEFRLFSEDLRPSNVLVDAEDRVVGVIDWVFAYVAPAQFSRDPPWWLLLKGRSDYWPGGHEAFMEAYEGRLGTCLRVLEVEEGKMREEAGGAETGETNGDDVVDSMAALALENSLSATPLSQLMRDSWTSKTFLTSLATRDSWTFDFLFWEYLDGKYFEEEGENEERDHRARISLLTEREREAMEDFVGVKMAEKEERVLVEWGLKEAEARLAKVMF